jgi:predicted dehydrogenase
VKKRISIGIIGCGYWGPNLLRNFAALSDCEVKVVCDLDAARLQHLQHLYPLVEISSNYSEVLARPDIDAVAIATPAVSHFSMSRQALLAGKHVLVEKPMAMSSAECDELMEIAAERRLTLMVGHTFMFSAPIRRIKEIIDAGDIGELRYISARRLNLGLFQRNINVAWDLAPHDISNILYVTGLLPLTVNCQGNSHVTRGIEDVTSMCLMFERGIFATVQSSWLDPRKIREMTIVGSRRMIVYDDVQPIEKVRIYDARVETPPHYDSFAEFQFSYHYGDSYIPYIKQEEPLKGECQHFIDCIRTGQRPITDGRHGGNVVRVLEASSRSLQRGGAAVPLEAPRTKTSSVNASSAELIAA